MSTIPDPASTLDRWDVPDRGDVPDLRPRGDSPGARAMAVLPFALAVVAEGAWVAAIYSLVQAAAHEQAPLGPAGMAVAAAAGLLIARRWGPGLGARWPWVALGLVALASLVGVLASPHAIETLLASGPVEALRANPGGALVGLAFLRGTAHARVATSEEVLDRLMAIGLPALVVPVLLAGALPEPWRTEATTGAVVAIAVFLVAGTVGLAVTRISAIGGSAGFDWRRNRAWLALVALLAVGIVAAALPAAVVAMPDRVTLHLEGWPDEIDEQTDAARAVAELTLAPPFEVEWPDAPIIVEAAVPSSRLGALVGGATAWTALAGVGVAWIGVADEDELATIRETASALGGIAPVVRGPGGLGDAPIPAPEVHRRLKTSFDPAGILAPGRFWGGI